MAETLNGVEIYSTDEITATIAMYLRTAQDANKDNYDVHTAATDLYDELVKMNTIKTFKNQVTEALRKENNE